MSRARPPDKPRLRRSFAVPEPVFRACRIALAAVSLVFLTAWAKHFLWAHVTSEATRKAPAQTELRPSFALPEPRDNVSAMIKNRQ
jgi:hypothetical protein